jgi:hypothetical protein
VTNNLQGDRGPRRAIAVMAVVIALGACAYAGAQQPRRAGAAADKPRVTLKPIATTAKSGRRANAGPSANSGQQMQLAGSGFTEAVSVEFLGFAGSPFLISPVKTDEGRGLSIVVPEAAVTGPVRLVDPTAGSSNEIRLQIVPTITTLSPASVAPGARLLIDGSGFTHNATVRFPGVKKPVPPKIVSPTRIDIVVPPGARTGAVTVLTTGGSSNTKPLAVASNREPPKANPPQPRRN